MINKESLLNVYLGENIIAKLILQNDELNWQYTPKWLTSGYAISPHLPLSDNIPSINVRRFLQNLTPEGHGLEDLLTNFQLSRSNLFGLMLVLGMDIPGALIMLPNDKVLPEQSHFRPITAEEIETRLEERNEISLTIWDGKPRLSVAGIQDKINVFVNEQNKIGFAEGKLCSTYLLKFEKQKLSHLVLNEYVTMQLARHCGLAVADVQLLRYGQYPALLVKRFDREMISSNEVKRFHIIDGCQALNLPPEYKYERNFGSNRDVAHIRDGASLPKLFEFANQCFNPIVTKQNILDWVLFNLLVFNYDAHGKNISFFVTADGITLAPFYDLVNIKMYHDFEHEMAMALGDEFDSNFVNAYQLADFADTCQLPRALVAKRLKFLIDKLSPALNLEISQIINTEEKNYLHQYKAMIVNHSAYLYKEADEIVAMRL